jgi:hypothetical protein
MGARIASRSVVAGLLVTASLGIGAASAGASSFSPGIVEFGGVAPGKTVTKTTQIVNGCAIVFPQVGCAQAETTSVSPTVIGSGFSLAGNGCPPTLTVAEEKCTITVSFSGSGAGFKQGELLGNSAGNPKALLHATVAGSTKKGKCKKKGKGKGAAAAKKKKGCKKK